MIRVSGLGTRAYGLGFRNICYPPQIENQTENNKTNKWKSEIGIISVFIGIGFQKLAGFRIIRRTVCWGLLGHPYSRKLPNPAKSRS